MVTRTSFTRIVVLSAVALAVAGCGGGAATGAGAAQQQAPDPGAVVGWWQITGTDQRIAVDPEAFEITDGCAGVVGSWRADPEARFVARVDTSTPCADGTEVPAPDWVARAGSFAVDGEEVVIGDRSGGELVRFAAGERFPGTGFVDPGRALEGGSTDARQAAPLPAGADPVDAGAITGRWLAEGSTAPAWVDFGADGTWTGSDGCNGGGGSWTTGAGGGFLATAPTVTTLIACDGGAPVNTQVGQARRAAVADGTLVLFDVDGEQTGRFVRG